MKKNSRKVGVKLLIWIIVIILILAVFSPFVAYIFMDPSTMTQ